MTVLNAVAAPAALVPTPNIDVQPRRYADFDTFCDALDYAAKGKLGFNFHDPRGTLSRVYPYSELRSDALVAARRLVAMGGKIVQRRQGRQANVQGELFHLPSWYKSLPTYSVCSRRSATSKAAENNRPSVTEAREKSWLVLV